MNDYEPDGTGDPSGENKPGLTEITGLWDKTAESSGRRYYYATLKKRIVLEPGTVLMLFKNEKRASNRQPALRLMVQAPKAEEPRFTPDPSDDIPF